MGGHSIISADGEPLRLPEQGGARWPGGHPHLSGRSESGWQRATVRESPAFHEPPSKGHDGALVRASAVEEMHLEDHLKENH